MWKYKTFPHRRHLFVYVDSELQVFQKELAYQYSPQKKGGSSPLSLTEKKKKKKKKKKELMLLGGHCKLAFRGKDKMKVVTVNWVGN